MARKPKSPDTKPEWAKRLTAIRTLSGLTQGEFAEKLGMSQQRYGNYETGTSEPNIDTLLKISRITGQTIDYIIQSPKTGSPKSSD